MLLPLYALGIILTIFSSEEFVNVAWDSAGDNWPCDCSTCFSNGVRFREAVSAIEGFGILSLASICPIIAVLSTGLIIQVSQNRKSLNEPKSLEEI